METFFQCSISRICYISASGSNLHFFHQTSSMKEWNSIIKFSHDTKLFVAISNQEDLRQLQVDLDQIQPQSEKRQIIFNVTNCESFQIGLKSPIHKFTIRATTRKLSNGKRFS